jgi:hypothetical protein
MTTPAGAVASDASRAQQQAARPGEKQQGFFSRKYGPLPGWGWSLVVAGGALAYFWWRKRQAAGSTAAATGTTAGATASSIGALQREIDALQNGTAGTTSGGGGGTVGGGTGGTGTTTSGTTSGTGTGTTKTTSGTGTGTTKTTSPTTGTTTGTTTTKTTVKTTPPPAPKVSKPAAPHNPSVTKVTATSAVLHWDATGSVAAEKLQFYNWHVYKGSAQVKQGLHAAHGDVTVTGLSPSTTYTFDVVAGNSAGYSPPSARVSFKTLAK